MEVFLQILVLLAVGLVPSVQNPNAQQASIVPSNAAAPQTQPAQESAAAVPAAPAAQNPAGPPADAAPPARQGLVLRVQGSALTITHSGTEETVETDDRTVIVVRGKPATLAGLTPGQRVFVTPLSGVAAKVEVPLPPPPKPRDPNAPRPVTVPKPPATKPAASLRDGRIPVEKTGPAASR